MYIDTRSKSAMGTVYEHRLYMQQGRGHSAIKIMTVCVERKSFSQVCTDIMPAMLTWYKYLVFGVPSGNQHMFCHNAHIYCNGFPVVATY